MTLVKVGIIVGDHEQLEIITKNSKTQDYKLGFLYIWLTYGISIILSRTSALLVTVK